MEQESPPSRDGHIGPAAKLGRKRDHTRDPEILDAALEVLAEVGYDRMTMDMVAARDKAGKATVHRRRLIASCCSPSRRRRWVACLP